MFITTLQPGLLTKFLTALVLYVLILYTQVAGPIKLWVDSNFYLLSEFLPEIYWEEIAKEILCFDVWPEVRTLAFSIINQPTRPRRLRSVKQYRKFFYWFILKRNSRQQFLPQTITYIIGHYKPTVDLASHFFSCVC